MATWVFNYAGQPLARHVSDDNKTMISKLISETMAEGRTAWADIDNQTGPGGLSFMIHPAASFSFETE
jgi:hypothetical protein